MTSVRSRIVSTADQDRHAEPAEGQPPHLSFGLRTLLTPSVFVNAVAPAILYALLTSKGVPSFNALLLVGLLPLLGIGVGLIRTHHVDAVGVVSLAFIVVGVATSLISGDERFLLVKESLITGAFGLICFLSLLLPRPLLFFLARSAVSGGSPERGRDFDALWQHEAFRHTMRILTIVWGAGYLVEAATRVLLLNVLPITTFLAVSQGLALGTTVLLIVWTVRYTAAARKRAAAQASTCSPDGGRALPGQDLARSPHRRIAAQTTTGCGSCQPW